MSASSVFAATSGTYEYNDFNLYSTNGTWYSSGALRSDNGSLDTFTITVNVNTNTWSITGGTTQPIPFPSGTSIYYTDRTTFLQSAYAIVNDTRYNFSFVDNSGVFYLQNIPAGPYYPTVTIYLPTSGGSGPSVPSTPILTFTDPNLIWTPSNYPAQIWFNATGQGQSTNITPSTAPNGVYPPYNLNLYDTYETYGEGYYYVRLVYDYEGQTRYTEMSEGLYIDSVTPSGGGNDGSNDGPLWQIIRYLDNLRNSTKNAFNVIKQSCEEFFDFMSDLVGWLPQDVTSVFFAVVIIGLVIGLFLK